MKTRNDYDVIVVGGGVAGIAAALSANRAGARTLLIESMYMLGGLATAGLVTIYLPLCDGVGKQLSYGISEELLRLSIQYGAENEYPAAWLQNGNDEKRMQYRYRTQYNPQVFAILTEKLLVSEGVEILYGATLSGVKMDNNKIVEIMVSTRTANLVFTAKSFVDCTGDATLCDYAGELTALSEKENVLASWYYETSNGEYCLRQCGSSDYVYSNIKTKDTFVGLDARELSALTIRSHDSVLRNYLQNGGVSKKHSLSTISTIPQVRMTRRLCGVVEIKKKDNKRVLNDSVGLFGSWIERGYAFELPIGALYGRKVSNLTVAGRCISVENTDMWDITRVIPVCAQSGEAAGVIAAIYDDNNKIKVRNVQKILAARGVKLHLSEVYK